MPGQENSSPAPRDARAIAALLKGMGVERYEAGVVHMLLDTVHAHVGDLLRSALVVADHAGRSDIEPGDLQLAANTQRTHAGPLQRTALLSLARERNSVPLPLPQVSLFDPDAASDEVPLPPLAHRLRPQVGVEIELPPKETCIERDMKVPWTITVEERMALEKRAKQQTEQQQQEQPANSKGTGIPFSAAAPVSSQPDRGRLHPGSSNSVGSDPSTQSKPALSDKGTTGTTTSEPAETPALNHRAE